MKYESQHISNVIPTFCSHAMHWRPGPLDAVPGREHRLMC